MKAPLLTGLLTCVSALALADSTQPSPTDTIQPYGPPSAVTPPPAPWFTGPLIAPIGAIIPYGDFEIETYLYCTTDTGTYNSHWGSVSAQNNFFSLNPKWLCFFGLTSWMDINITPQFFYNTTAGQGAVRFGDLPIALDFQLLDPSATPYFPGIKFTIQETFPTEAFENLNPNKLLTDDTGAGAFGTTFNLVFYKVYHLVGHCFLSSTISAAYTINTSVHVHGFNTYGGGYGTSGTVLPGNTFQGIVSFELSLSQNWALALDNVYTHVDISKFYGNVGVNAAGAPATVGVPSSEQISFAPAIEYAFSSNLGIIAGAWVTGWGRNSPIFRSGVVNLTYTY